MIEKLTDSIWYSPSSEALSAGQQIPCVVGIPKIQYHVHNSPPPVPVQSQMNPAHSLLSYFIS